MKTLKTIKLVGLLCVFLFSTNIQGQKLGKILKKKATEVVDEVLNEGDKKNEQKTDKGDKVILPVENRVPVKNFIDGSIVFSDNFNNERSGEFPSKWIQINGAVENMYPIIFGKKEGVIEWISNSATIKPNIKEDNYLGDSFMIETQVYFHGGGNEYYVIGLKNTQNSYKNHDLRISWFGLHSSSDVISRIQGIAEGWHTIQISFNKGNLKAFYDGVQLINNPDIGKYEFNHLELKVGSPGSTRPEWRRATINYFTIGGKGLALYKRLVTEGRLVVHDILFDNNSYFITPSSYPAIDRIVAMLKNNPETQVTIEGHTDANGSNKSNQTLSEYRAKAVMNYMISKGVDANKLKSVGYGEERPMVTGNNEEAWSQNRRVEFVMNKY